MRRLSLLLILVFISLTVLATPAYGSERNIFGLHLTQTSDIEKAAPLINSSGGRWGWATIVIRLDQLDTNIWQDFFNKCRKLHIIPIVRLATMSQNGVWQRPARSDIDRVATFLNGLNWPTTKQYIILFNEINHGQEWGGAVDIKDFTDTALYTIDKFKSLNQNFFILSPGLDLATPQQPPQYESAPNVYQEIHMYKKEYFEKIDGLSSHSYPNHGFIGTPSDTGQHSIRGYLWELDTIRNYGISKELPVFITETGWPHREGESIDNKFYTSQTTTDFLKDALSIWQKDPKIMAVTPFIYNYPYAPFDHFSWVDKSEKLLSSYQKIIDLPKNTNIPDQSFLFEVVNISLPIFMFPENEYSGEIWFKNTGQSIWGKDEFTFCLNPTASSNITLDSICADDQITYPGEIKKLFFKFRLDKAIENSFISWEKTPAYQIKSILPLLTHAQIYRPENGIFERLKKILLIPAQFIKIDGNP